MCIGGELNCRKILSIESLAVCLNHSKASGTDKLILIGIANHDGDGGAWPTIKTLARYANVSERAVQYSLEKLAALGEIEIHVNKGGNENTRSDRRPNRYDVLVKCPDSCDRTQQHRDGVKPSTQRGEAQRTHGVKPSTGRGEVGCTLTILEPSLEPPLNQYGEIKISANEKLLPIVNAQDITAAYVDHHKVLHGCEPPKASIGRVARAAKAMDGQYSEEVLMAAARQCAESGHANLSAAVTWVMAAHTRQQQKSNGGASAFLRLAKDTSLELLDSR